MYVLEYLFISYSRSCLYIPFDMIYVIHGNKITFIVIVIVIVIECIVLLPKSKTYVTRHLDRDYTCFQQHFGFDFHAILLRCQKHDWVPVMIWIKKRSKFVSHFSYKQAIVFNPPMY